MKEKILYYVCIFILLLGIKTYQHSSFCSQNVNPKTILVIDIGHGGFDPGKVSTSGIKEKDINLQIGCYLKDYLIAKDYTVYLTRDSDVSLSSEGVRNKKSSDLQNRVLFADKVNANYLISIHQNSFPSPSSHGAQTFYFQNSTESEALAHTIQESLLAFDPSNKRIEKASSSYYILKHTVIPSVIVECGFLSNPEEAEKLASSIYQKQIAEAIANGIDTYLSKR